MSPRRAFLVVGFSGLVVALTMVLLSDPYRDLDAQLRSAHPLTESSRAGEIITIEGTLGHAADSNESNRHPPGLAFGLVEHFDRGARNMTWRGTGLLTPRFRVRLGDGRVATVQWQPVRDGLLSHLPGNRRIRADASADERVVYLSVGDDIACVARMMSRHGKRRLLQLRAETDTAIQTGRSRGEAFATS